MSCNKAGWACLDPKAGRRAVLLLEVAPFLVHARQATQQHNRRVNPAALLHTASQIASVHAPHRACHVCVGFVGKGEESPFGSRRAEKGVGERRWCSRVVGVSNPWPQAKLTRCKDTVVVSKLFRVHGLAACRWPRLDKGSKWGLNKQVEEKSYGKIGSLRRATAAARAKG